METTENIVMDVVENAEDVVANGFKFDVKNAGAIGLGVAAVAGITAIVVNRKKIAAKIKNIGPKKATNHIKVEEGSVAEIEVEAVEVTE